VDVTITPSYDGDVANYCYIVVISWRLETRDTFESLYIIQTGSRAEV